MRDRGPAQATEPRPPCLASLAATRLFLLCWPQPLRNFTRPKGPHTHAHNLQHPAPQALAYCVAVPFLLRIVEPVYGAREVLRFLACVLFVTGTTTFLLVFLLYVASLDQAKAGALL